MAIDRIGKGGPVAPPQAPSEANPAEKAEKTGRTFEVRSEKSEAKAGAAEVGGVAATPLARLHAGHVDVNGYLDLKVEEATAALKGLNPTELSAIQKMLREQLVSDPALSDLVKSAAGATPSLPEE